LLIGACRALLDVCCGAARWSSGLPFAIKIAGCAGNKVSGGR
jgi:hypothetical protein